MSRVWVLRCQERQHQFKVAVFTSVLHFLGQATSRQQHPTHKSIPTASLNVERARNVRSNSLAAKERLLSSTEELKS